MKTKLFAFVLMASAVIMFNGCNKDDLLSKDLDLVLYQDLTVNNTTDTVFTGSQILDASAQSADIEKYKDNIEDLSVTKITYFLTAFNGAADQELTSGAMAIADTNGTNPVALTAMSNVLLSGLLNNETELMIADTAKTVLVNKIKNGPHALRINYLGVVNKKPIDFTMKLRFYFKMKVKII